MKKQKKIPVIFRVLPGSANVVALYPTLTDEKGDCVVHSLVFKPSYKAERANYKHIVEHSRPALPNEAQDLLKVLREEAPVKVMQKWNGKRKVVVS